MYSVSYKLAPLKTFCNIFTQAKCISVKFCQFVANLYLHIATNFDRFILIFNKMALIFLGVLIVFTVSSFEFRKVIQTTAVRRAYMYHHTRRAQIAPYTTPTSNTV